MEVGDLIWFAETTKRWARTCGLLSHHGRYASSSLNLTRHAISIGCQEFNMPVSFRFRPHSTIQVTPEVTPENGMDNS